MCLNVIMVDEIYFKTQSYSLYLIMTLNQNNLWLALSLSFLINILFIYMIFINFLIPLLFDWNCLLSWTALGAMGAAAVF